MRECDGCDCGDNVKWYREGVGFGVSGMYSDIDKEIVT